MNHDVKFYSIPQTVAQVQWKMNPYKFDYSSSFQILWTDE